MGSTPYLSCGNAGGGDAGGGGALGLEKLAE